MNTKLFCNIIKKINTSTKYKLKLKKKKEKKRNSFFSEIFIFNIL